MSRGILQKNGRFSVNDSVWIAAAVMSYERYYTDGCENITEFTFLQKDIRERASQINGADVEAARTSQWCCGDHKNHTHPYLRKIGESSRRLAFPEEFEGGEIPSGLNENDSLTTSAGIITVKQLIDFVNKEYKALEAGVVHITHLKEMIEKILNEYATEKTNPFGANPLGQYIRSDAPNIIKNAARLSTDEYVVSGSVGQGGWAMVPWLGIFNKKVTTSATKGVYIVYLIEKDGNSIYLTFNQGCTELKSNHSKEETIRLMREKAVFLIDKLDNYGYKTDEDINLGEGLTELAELYQKGTIFYKEYKKGMVPEEEELRADLLNMIKIYNQYISEIVEGNSDFYPSIEDYNPRITAAEYERILCDERLVKKSWLDILVCLYRMGGVGSCKQIANKYGKSAPHYNTNGINIAKAVAKATGCPLDIRETGENRYWPVLFFGKNMPANSADGIFCYKMREPLMEAVKTIEERGEFQKMKESIEFDKNIILYGPPGTGKTYNTAIYAVAICDDKSLAEIAALDYGVVMARYKDLKEAGCIAFTTFHQSYGYEEFIEGIKPVINDKDKSGNIKYSIEDGVFKHFCKESEGISFEEAWSKLIADAKADGNKYTFKRRTETQINAELMNDDLFSVQFNGKTSAHGNMTKSKVKEIYEQYSYENRDEIPNGGNKWVFDACYAVLDTLVDKYGLTEKHDIEQKNKVFIIDEINRGNISKIFGELITLIEGSKRKGMQEAVSAILPYSGKEFCVPANVYILGTMNTADRSIALMDTALRRRFQFVEMMPNSEVLKGITVDGLNIASMLDIINKRIEFLYDREHTIGHAFFMALKDNPTVECLASIFSKSVIPLLQEYFYEDYQKIQLVLGDTGKKEDESNLKFIKDIKVVEKDIFVGKVEDVIDLPEKSYSINPEAFMNIESYKRIAPGL